MEMTWDTSVTSLLLRARGRSNSEPRMRPRFMIKRVMMVGLRPGSVTCQMRLKRPAPSTAAASYSSGLMPVSAAR